MTAAELTTKTILIGCLVWGVAIVQMSAAPPPKWKSAMGLEEGPRRSWLDLPHNSSEQIRKELSDTNLLRLIAKDAGLTEEELTTVTLAPDRAHLTLYLLGTNDKAFKILGARLTSYIGARHDGHTSAFLLTAITNRAPPLSIADPDLRMLALNEPFLPVALMKRVASGAQTNRAGEIAGISTTTTIINGKLRTTTVTNVPASDEIHRWVEYEVADGELDWSYMVHFEADGGSDSVSQFRRDAKDGDPRFLTVIKEVEDEAHADMKKNGTFGRVGSVHTFWQLKKEKLRARNIEWRSPAELNPNARYD